MYNLYDRVFHDSLSKDEAIKAPGGLFIALTNFIMVCKPYFPEGTTGELCKIILPSMNMVDMRKLRFLVFFPTMVNVDQNEQDFKQWLEPFLYFFLCKSLDKKSYVLRNYWRLFANVAKDGIGYIDWQPYLSKLFDAFCTRAFTIQNKEPLSLKSLAIWIVYMIDPNDGGRCLQHLEKLFKLILSGLFQSSSGKTNLFKLLNFCINSFCDRVHNEKVWNKYDQHQKDPKQWYPSTPSSHRLTSLEIDRFCSIIRDQFMTVEHIHLIKVESFVSLAKLNPRMFSPYLFSILEQAEEEEDGDLQRMLIALRYIAVCVAPIMTTDTSGSEEDAKMIQELRPKLAQLLVTLVKSINLYHSRLAFHQISAIYSIILLDIPLYDCSDMVGKAEKKLLSTNDKQFLNSTRQFDDILEQFTETCLNILESNNSEMISFYSPRWIYKKSLKEIVSDVLFRLLRQSKTDQVKASIDRIVSYLTCRQIEDSVSASFGDELLQACIQVSPGYTLEQMIDYLHEYFTDNEQFSKQVNETKITNIRQTEFNHNSRLLTTVLSESSPHLLIFKKKILDILDVVYAIDYEKKHIPSCINYLFYSLTRDHVVGNVPTYPTGDLNQQALLGKLCHWPQMVPMSSDLGKWYIPSQEDLQFAHEIYARFVEPQLERFEKWSNISNEEEGVLNNGDKQKCLSILSEYAKALKLFIYHPTGEGQDEPIKSYGIEWTKMDIFNGDSFDRYKFSYRLATACHNILFDSKKFEKLDSSDLKKITSVSFF